MFDSRALGPTQPPRRPAVSADSAPRVVPKEAAPASSASDRSLALLRQLRGRWVSLLGSESGNQVSLEAGAYMSKIADAQTLQAKELRYLGRLNSGRSRPVLDADGKPVQHDPQDALKRLDRQIRTLSDTQAGSGESVTRLRVQVNGANQPMRSGSYQGTQTETRHQRDTSAKSELLETRPQPKATRTTEGEGKLNPVAQNRTTIRWSPAPPERRPSAEAEGGQKPGPVRVPRPSQAAEKSRLESASSPAAEKSRPGFASERRPGVAPEAKPGPPTERLRAESAGHRPEFAAGAKPGPADKSPERRVGFAAEAKPGPPTEKLRIESVAHRPESAAGAKSGPADKSPERPPGFAAEARPGTFTEKLRGESSGHRPEFAAGAKSGPADKTPERRPGFAAEAKSASPDTKHGTSEARPTNPGPDPHSHESAGNPGLQIPFSSSAMRPGPVFSHTERPPAEEAPTPEPPAKPAPPPTPTPARPAVPPTRLEEPLRPTLSAPPPAKPIADLKPPLSLASVKLNPPLEPVGERATYPDWLQVKLKEDASPAAPAYRTALPKANPAPKAYEDARPSQPQPQARINQEDRPRTDYRPSDPALARAAQHSGARQAMAPQPAPTRSTTTTAKTSQSSASSKTAEPESLLSAPVEAAVVTPVARVERKQQETEEIPGLKAGWEEDSGNREARLENGRQVTGQVPIYSPVLDAMVQRRKVSTGEVPSKPDIQVEDRSDQDRRGRGGSGGSGGQQERRDGQSAPLPNTADQQQLQSARRLNADQKAELKTLEAFRLAKTEAALQMGLKMQNNPQGQQLSQLVAHHAGHAMESMLKKAYRLDSLGELDEEEAVNALGLVLKLGGEFTFAHSARVLELAMELADEVGIRDRQTRDEIRHGAMFKDIGEMGLLLDQAPPEKLEKMADFLSSQDLRKAGLLHDLGKTRIPPEILYKPGKLTEEEYQIMKMHPVYGEEMVYPIQSLRHLCPAIRGHHERWDGKGYPDQLAGEEIPLSARIIAVADVFDALAAERPYKAGMPVERVQAILKEGRGTHFDPDLLDAFERVLQRRFPELSNPFA